MSTDWTAGYVADIGYTYGYYGELNPLRTRLPLLHANVAPPQIQTACELGFGQGLSTNIHAAASTVEWYGTDFNPSQAAFAQEMAAAAGGMAKLWDEAFVDFAQRTDLPDFDFIAMHGIWSWVSEENRAVLADFLRRKLKVGGVLYISYNTMPGWAAFAPLRHLMMAHSDIVGSQGQGTVSRLDHAIDFADRLFKTNPTFAAANPQVAVRLEGMKNKDRHYLAHEYFNRNWHPMAFRDTAERLAEAKLDYVCSATYVDHVDAINLRDDQQTFLREISDPTLRESVRDFMVNQQFRRDYWVKGARPMPPFSRIEKLRAHRVQLAIPREQVSLTVKGALGDGSLSPDLYDPILNFLADRKPTTLGQIEHGLKDHPQISFAHIVEAALLLGNSTTLAAAQEDAVVATVRPQTDRLNDWVASHARGSDEIGSLASPVTGGGVAVSRIHQLFLHARAKGGQTPRDWAAATWEILGAQGHQLVKEGVTLEGHEANLGEMTLMAEAFSAEVVPSLIALGITSDL